MKLKTVLIASLLLVAFSSLVLSKATSNKEPKVVYKTASQINDQKEANKPAEARYAKNPDGNDNFDLVKDGELLIIVSSHNHQQEPQVHHVRLNKNAIYYSEKGKSFRGVLGSIQLQDLLSPEDAPENGTCCSKIQKITSKQIKIRGAVKDYECFELSGPERWELCSKDSDLIFEWRKAIKLQLMVGSLLKRGLTNVRIFLPEEEKSVDCTNPQGWTWKSQQDWPCSCKDGEVQAPLKLLSGESKKQSKVRLTWNYHDVTNPQAVFNGHEIEIRGSFGSFSLHHPNSKKDYFANRITFKFPSEHHIDSNVYEGELLIHHESGGEKAILSIMLQEDVNNEADDNSFLDKLTPEYWNTRSKDPVVIEGVLNLEKQIVKGGATHHFKKTFFSYVGADSVPPCTQNVLRVVMRDPLVIPSLQLQELRARAFNNDEEPEGNSRKARDNSDGIEVIYHVDNSPSCPSKLDQEIENSASEKIAQEAAKRGEVVLGSEDEIKDKEENKEAKKEHEYELPDKFIKATSTVETYGLTGSSPILGDLGNGIVLEEVKQAAVPDYVRNKLLKDAQNLAKQIAAKHATQSKLAEPAANAASE